MKKTQGTEIEKLQSQIVSLQKENEQLQKQIHHRRFVEEFLRRTTNVLQHSAEIIKLNGSLLKDLDYETNCIIDMSFPIAYPIQKVNECWSELLFKLVDEQREYMERKGLDMTKDSITDIMEMYNYHHPNSTVKSIRKQSQD